MRIRTWISLGNKLLSCWMIVKDVGCHSTCRYWEISHSNSDEKNRLSSKTDYSCSVTLKWNIFEGQLRGRSSSSFLLNHDLIVLVTWIWQLASLKMSLIEKIMFQPSTLWTLLATLSTQSLPSSFAFKGQIYDSQKTNDIVQIL